MTVIRCYRQGNYMNKFTIRYFSKKDDFEDVLEMEQECFDEFEAWTREQYEEILYNPNLHFFVAYDENTLAGSTFVFVNQKDDKDITHLDHNVVSPRYRRQGLGRHFTLLRLDTGRQAGDRKAIVEVAEDNIPSIKLLKSVGFKEYGRFPKYYKNKKDAILMHMFLDRTTGAIYPEGAPGKPGTSPPTENDITEMKIRLMAGLLYEIHDKIEDLIDVKNRIV